MDILLQISQIYAEHCLRVSARSAGAFLQYPFEIHAPFDDIDGHHAHAHRVAET
jgi:hypothetical protein